jgi:arsenite methyltransferase
MTQDQEADAGTRTGASPPRSSRRALRETYGELARSDAVQTSCCVPTGAAPGRESSASASSEGSPLGLGCGDPVSLADLQPGETVLDLGSGAGGDCFRAAREVGGAGHVIGVDMTPEMLDRARATAEETAAGNVEFRLGEIEHLPVPDGTVDVVLSNCVVSLSPDKAGVFREAYRVLRPNGRLALSEMMTDGPLPEAIRAALGGAATGVWAKTDYVAAIEAAGFVGVTVERVEVDRSLRAEIERSAPPGGARASLLGERSCLAAWSLLLGPSGEAGSGPG